MARSSTVSQTAAVGAIGGATGGEHRQHPDVVAAYFRALSDPTRLLEFILRGERTVADCVEHAQISQPRVSVHLSCLAGCGYVADDAAALSRCRRVPTSISVGRD